MNKQTHINTVQPNIITTPRMDKDTEPSARFRFRLRPPTSNHRRLPMIQYHKYHARAATMLMPCELYYTTQTNKKIYSCTLCCMHITVPDFIHTCRTPHTYSTCIYVSPAASISSHLNAAATAVAPMAHIWHSMMGRYYIKLLWAHTHTHKFHTLPRERARRAQVPQ